MKSFKLVSVTLALLLVCAACGGSSSVDKAVSRVEKALEKVEKNKGKMTEDDWKALEKEVEEPLKVISDALEKDEVGMIGKMKILAVTAKWATTLAEAGVSELEKKTGVEREKWGQELEKAVKESDSDIGKEIEKAAQELQRIAAEK
jgi:TRAP-type C4-dicarboxylate transport system substrate-binding protein